jgi:hypothetical protein
LSRPIAILGVVFASCLGLGCGPIEYSAVILDAHSAMAEAQEADAHIHAPYEYYYAREHIQKAREEAGYADYQAAVQFGRTAEEYALKARDIARRRRREMGR